MDEIEGWRKRIDEIDTQLMELLNERAKCAMAIGKIKMAKGLKLYSPEREKAVLEHIKEQNKGPLENSAVERIFEHIIEESRRIEIIAV
ncbi:MAG: chorismate mutase [Candidatus Latescibacter sp.]|nr:chorismate mutase [Candidatus Latescibacter sp.]